MICLVDRTVGRKVDQLWSFAFGAKMVEEDSLSLRVRKFWLLSFDPQIQSKTAIGVLGSTRGGKLYCPHSQSVLRVASSILTI